MLLKVDKGTWIEIPNDSTEEFKQAKLKQYADKRADELKKLRTHSYIYKDGLKPKNIGGLYDKRVSLTEIIHNYR